MSFTISLTALAASWFGHGPTLLAATGARQVTGRPSLSGLPG
ncbi:hypothetical protein AB0F72_27645 [Actinoplanes sp. NPDC023936]